MPRVDVETSKGSDKVEGTVLVRSGSLPHSFPDGDPILKQFFVTVTLKDAKGVTVASEVKHIGLPYDQILRGPIPDPLIKGGTTRRLPFSLALPSGSAAPVSIEALLTYSLIPEPTSELQAKYLATLPSDKDRETATTLIHEYSQPRVLTFRIKAL
jgi:hypothetical protein